MKIEKQVCTLEQAKRLKELGVKQETNFYWVEFSSADAANNDDNFALCREASKFEQQHGVSWVIVGAISKILQRYIENYGNDNTASGATYAALSVAELTLPEWAYSKLNSGGGEKYCCLMVEGHLRIPNKMKNLKDFYAATEVMVRADTLIYLLENNLIKVEEVNNRLQ